VVLHGWAMHSMVWKPVARQLEAVFKVSWVDLPGHGVNREVTALSLTAVLDLLKPHIPQDSHIMGWSLGGLIAQALTNEITDRINSLTFIASTPRFSQTDNWPHAMSQAVLDQFADNLEQDLDATIKRFIALQFMGIPEARTLQRALTQEILQGLYQNPEVTDENNALEDNLISQTVSKRLKSGGGVLSNPQKVALKLGLDALKQADYRHQALAMPQHWLLAGKDRLIPPLMRNDLKKMRPNAQISFLKNAGHAPFMTHPDEFLHAVIPFIQSHA